MFTTSVIVSLIANGGVECLRHLLLEDSSFSHRHIWIIVDRTKHPAQETPKPGPKRGKNSENGTPITIVAIIDEVIDTPLLKTRPKRQKHLQLRKALYVDSEESEIDENWEFQEADYKPNESEDSSEEDMKEFSAKGGDERKRRERFINSLKSSKKRKLPQRSSDIWPCTTISRS